MENAQEPQSTAAEVAQWMAQQLEGDDQAYASLSQNWAAFEIQQRFGENFVYYNKNGNLAIAKPVLDAFLALTGAAVVWERGSRSWRRRQEYDPPGRQAS